MGRTAKTGGTHQSASASSCRGCDLQAATSTPCRMMLPLPLQEPLLLPPPLLLEAVLPLPPRCRCRLEWQPLLESRWESGLCGCQSSRSAIPRSGRGFGRKPSQGRGRARKCTSQHVHGWQPASHLCKAILCVYGLPLSKAGNKQASLAGLNRLCGCGERTAARSVCAQQLSFKGEMRQAQPVGHHFRAQKFGL